MFYFFILSKIFLTVGATYLIVQGSPWLLSVFIFFIVIDLVDSKVMGLSYRPYDSFFDRLFAYGCFFAFLIFSNPVYPTILYIGAFAVRDFFVAGAIQGVNNYMIRSNALDRLTMLLTAIFFALQAGHLIPNEGRVVEIACYFIAGLIIYQGLEKVKRVRKFSDFPVSNETRG